MKKHYLLGIMSLSALLFFSCGSTEPVVAESNDVPAVAVATSTNSNLPADTVVIGTQTWKNSNLNTIVFRNGDTLLQAKTNEEWVNAAKNQIPAWCYADNNAENGEKFGKLYNYWAVIDPRGLAPAGWRIPSDADFATLVQFVGADGAAKVKSTSMWENGGNGNNSSGFNALPGGYRNATGLFNPIGRLTSWWTVTEKSSGSAFGYKIIAADNNFVQSDFYKRSGLSVRCLR